MNSGIYALYWWEQDLVYIGLSQDLQSRKTEHYYRMRNSTHSNYKVQRSFNEFGIPDFIVLEYCTISNLNCRETWWTLEFDAIRNGLCLVEPGNVPYGALARNSKYSKATILKSFLCLSKGYSFTYISKRLNVPKSLLADIKHSRSHLWLLDKYPEVYACMLQASNNSNRCTVSASLIDPLGNVYVINDLPAFSREHFNLAKVPTHLYSLVNGRRDSYRGYRLYKL